MPGVKTYRVLKDSVLAVQVLDTNIQKVAEWCGGVVADGAVTFMTPTGAKTAYETDYIVEVSDRLFTVYQEIRFKTLFEELK